MSPSGLRWLGVALVALGLAIAGLWPIQSRDCAIKVLRLGGPQIEL